MPKLYACIISTAETNDLVRTAHQFSGHIETLEDGVLFDVSGLERLIGKPDQIAQKILSHLKRQKISGNISVAETVDTAIILARQKKRFNHTVASPEEFPQLPLDGLGIERDSLGIFNELGINNIEQLRQIPRDDLVNRYGREFGKVIDRIEQNDRSFLTPNVKETRIDWSYNLDFAVEDFEQLIFIINHGLDDLLGQIEHLGLSTEQLDIAFKLCKSPHVSKGVTSNTQIKTYEIKTSFPTLEKTFWLKLINLRVSLDPPEAAILAVNVTAHFTKPRPNQKGLYAVSRPEPESLLLTVNKLKKLVGEGNVGVPVVLDERLAEPFALDGYSGIAAGNFQPLSEKHSFSANRAAQPLRAIIAFTYFKPPLRAEVLVRDARLIFIKTRNFSGHVLQYSGVWKANSKWWDRSWRTQEWDIEVEDHGVYRLCKVDKEWFLAGEYD